MKVVEFRLVLPLTPEEYRRCQIFLVALAALETAEAQKATGGPPKAPMIEVLATEDYNNNGEQGQYTHKRFDLAEKLPGWLLKFVDRGSCTFDEKSWNAYPRLRTQYESEKFSRAKISITSNHLVGVCTDDNATDLPPEALRMRKVDLIDIVNDRGGSASDEFRKWKSEKAQFGPLRSDWIQNVPLVPPKIRRAPRRPRGVSRRASQPPNAPDSRAGTVDDPRERPQANTEPSSSSGGSLVTLSGELHASEGTSAVSEACFSEEGPAHSEEQSSLVAHPPVADLVPAYPLMTCYKCFQIDFPYFGIISGKIEGWVVAAMREQLLHYHRRAVACIDKWYDLSLEEVRAFEEDVREQLAVLASLSRNATAASTGSAQAPEHELSGRPRSLLASPLPESVDGAGEAGADTSDSDESASGVAGRGEGAHRRCLEVVEEALDDWDVYQGYSLLPFRLSPRSVSLLQKLQQSIPNVSKLPQQDQQYQQWKARSFCDSPAGSPPPVKRDSPIRHGYLDKLGDGLWGSRWNLRYFLLRGNRLQYFDDPRDPRAKQSFVLTGAKVGWATDLGEKPFAFYVETLSRKRLTLSGASEEESRAWLMTLHQAASTGDSSNASKYMAGQPTDLKALHSLATPGRPFNLSEVLFRHPSGEPVNNDELSSLAVRMTSNAASQAEPVASSQPAESPLEQAAAGAPSAAASAACTAAQDPVSQRGSNGRLVSDNNNDKKQQVTEKLQQQVSGMKGPLKEALASLMKRCPWSRCFVGRGVAAPHMAFMGACAAKDGLDVQQQARGSQQMGALKRSLSNILEEAEGVGCRPSLSAEACAVGALVVSLLLVVLSAACAACCFSSLLLLMWRMVGGRFGPLGLFKQILNAASPTGILGWSDSPGRANGGRSWYWGAILTLFEAFRAAAAATVAALLLWGALYILFIFFWSKALQRKRESPAARAPPLLKAACLAEGPPESVLLCALPPEAKTVEWVPPDPSALGAGGPFLMEDVETLRPLDLLLSDPRTVSSLCWWALRREVPRLSDFLAWLLAPLIQQQLQEQRQHQAPQQERGLQQQKSEELTTTNKAVAAGMLLLQLLGRLLEHLMLICCWGGIALGGFLGAFLITFLGSLWVPLRLRRVSWSASLDGNGYLLFSQLSPLPEERRELRGSLQDDSASSFATKSLWKVIKKWALIPLRCWHPQGWEPLPQGASQETSHGAGGFEALLVVPLPAVPSNSLSTGLEKVQQLQQQLQKELQQQHWCLASLRLQKTPDADREGQTENLWASRDAASAWDARSWKSEAIPMFNSMASEAASESSACTHACVVETDESPCLVTWVGALRWGTRNVPHWLEGLLTLRQAEAALGSLLSHLRARRGLQSGGPPTSYGVRGPLTPSLHTVYTEEPPLGPFTACTGTENAGMNLVGPLMEFYKARGALKGFEAESLARQRAKQKYKDTASKPYPLAGWRKCAWEGLMQEESLELDKQRCLLMKLLRRQRADIPRGPQLPPNGPLPIGLLRAASLLLLLPDCMAQGPPILKKVFAGGPLEKFKATLAFAVSILHRGCWQAPPLAAYLGETFQGHLQEPAGTPRGQLGASQGGWLVYVEQTGVGPPSTLFSLSSPGSMAQVWGHLSFLVNYQPGRCVVTLKGKINVCFSKGEIFSFSLPELHIEGLLWGRRHFYWQGPLHVEGPDVCCTVIVAGDAQQGPYGGAFRDELFGQVLQKDSTHDKGTKRPECPLETLATVTGSYTDKLFWNDEEIWSVYTAQTLHLFAVPDEEALPIDSRFRADSLLLSLGDEDAADKVRRKQLAIEASDMAQQARFLRQQSEGLATSPGGPTDSRDPFGVPLTAHSEGCPGPQKPSPGDTQ